MDINSLHKIVSQIRHAEAPDEQFTLGKLIDALLVVPNREAKVKYDFGYLYPTTFESYRGYYEDLAIGYADGGRYGSDEQHTAAKFLALAEAASGATFTGWKGGDFTMHDDTLLWVANRGCTGGTTIVGVDADEYDVILRTAKIE